MSVIHFELHFVKGFRLIHGFACGSPTVSALFVEKDCSSTIDFAFLLCLRAVDYLCGSNSGLCCVPALFIHF